MGPCGDVRSIGRIARGLAVHDRPEQDRRPIACRRSAAEPRAVVIGRLGGSALGSSDDADADTLERVLASGMLVAGAVPPPSPERELSLRELRTALQQALAAMPEPERVVIVMAYAEDLSQSEIADRLGWPLGTVKTRTRRALRHLREVLGSGVGPEYTRYMAPAELAGPDH